MEIKIHRGLEQIGGCITEISTATSRVFIDMGQNLPGIGESRLPEEDRQMVERIFAQNQKEHQAVFYTHTMRITSDCSGLSLRMFRSLLARVARKS